MLKKLLVFLFLFCNVAFAIPPAPFNNWMDQKTWNQLGLYDLPKDKQKALGKWLESSLSQQKEEKAPPKWNATIKQINREEQTITLLDNTVWEVQAKFHLLSNWFPGQYVTMKASEDKEFPFLIGKEEEAFFPCAMVGGRQLLNGLNPLGFNNELPADQEVILKINKGNKTFTLSDQTVWEIPPFEEEKVLRLRPPERVQLQKSPRIHYPYTFMIISSREFLSAKQKKTFAKARKVSKTRSIKELIGFGEALVLEDNSSWITSPSSQEIVLNWASGDEIQVQKSSSKQFPYLLINHSNPSSALATLSSSPQNIPTPSTRPTTPSFSKRKKRVYIEKIASNGKLLFLNDGSLYKVAPIDRGVVDFWIPRDEVSLEQRVSEAPFTDSIYNVSRRQKARVQALSSS